MRQESKAAAITPVILTWPSCPALLLAWPCWRASGRRGRFCRAAAVQALDRFSKKTSDLEALFFPQPAWLSDVIHERILPLEGYQPRTNQNPRESY
jgi:hypothetical protein